jgi:ribosomal protein L13E
LNQAVRPAFRLEKPSEKPLAVVKEPLKIFAGKRKQVTRHGNS